MRNGIHLKKLILWVLYDFANSFAFITFFLYYSQWLVVDRGISDFWFNMTFVGSSLLFISTVPVASLIIDKIRIRIPGLRVVTILAIVFFAATALIALFAPDYYIISIITLSFAEYFYLFSFTFYNPLLREIATPEKQGLASGWGQFGNWIGEITGLLVAIPFATGAITLLGGAGRAQTLLPATILFTIFAIPLLLFFKEDSKKIETKINIASEYKHVFRSFINLCKSPGVGLFFLSYFFFNDAITTASNNFPIYVEAVFGSSDNIKSYLLIGILISSAISAPISGWIADKVGLRKTLWWVLGGWAIIFPAMAITTNFTVFVAVCIAMGLWFGSIWTVTRAYLLQLTPPEMITQSFTYYTLMERLATLVGPISWGLVVASLPTSGAFNYRMAAMVMALLVVIGLFFARKLPKTKTEMKLI